MLTADLALWAGRPGEALEEIIRELPALTMPVMYMGAPLLMVGMRACADLAETARARRDEAAAAEAAAAAADLMSWIDRLAVSPFTDLPGQVYPPRRACHLGSRVHQAERCQRSRPPGPRRPRPGLALGARTSAAYAWWRQAQALLDAGHPAAVAAPVLRTAAKAAQGHAPLLAQISALAERARIDPRRALSRSPFPAQGQAATTDPGRYGLTGRELSVLRLLARGRTNAQIGAELYMSPKTASVHVSSIFRKLGVSGRAQAAAVAERAGLLDSRQP